MNCDRDTPWLPKEDCSDEKVYSKEGARGLRSGLGGGAGGHSRQVLGQGAGRCDLGSPEDWTQVSTLAKKRGQNHQHHSVELEPHFLRSCTYVTKRSRRMFQICYGRSSVMLEIATSFYAFL